MCVHRYHIGWFELIETFMVYGGSVTVVRDPRTGNKTPAKSLPPEDANSLLKYLSEHRYADAHLEWFKMRFG